MEYAGVIESEVPQTPDRGTPESESVRVLLVDDDPDDRALVARELTREFQNVKIEQIEDSNHLFDAIGRGEFDLVITDYQLHWTDGLTVLRAVKVRWPDRPVIMFTGTGSEEIAVEAMKAGLDDYVLKSPHDVRRLPAAVRYALRLLQQRKAAADAESRYRSLVKDVPVGLYQVERNGRIIEANPSLVDMLGYPDRESLLVVNVDEIYVKSGDWKRLQELLDRGGVIRNLEVQVRCRDGRALWARNSALASLDDEGGVRYYEGSLLDITEQKQMQRRLLENERLASLGQLSSYFAHEIKTPLTTISLLVANLRRQTTDPGALQKLEKINEQRRNAASIISSVLDFSHAGKTMRGVQDLRPIVDAAIEQVEPYHKPEVQVVKIVEERPLVAPVDSLQVQEVLVNLVKNALQATNAGSVTIRVEEFPDTVSLAVSDTGCGMTPEVMDNLWKPGFTTKAHGEGVGLGLAICKSIVEAHGGHIDVTSEPGAGSTFTVVLPRSARS